MSRKVLVPLVLPANPASALEAVTKQYCDGQGVPIFASTAARDAAIPSPVVGQMCVTTDTGTLWQFFTGAGWYKPFQRLAAATRPSAAGPQGPEAVFLTTPAVTIPANRLVRVEAATRGINGAGGGSGFLHIRDGTTTAGTELYQAQCVFAAGGAGPAVQFGITVSFGSTAAHQFSLSVDGSGTGATVTGAATYPTWIQVTDVGGT